MPSGLPGHAEGAQQRYEVVTVITITFQTGTWAEKENTQSPLR